MLCPGEWELKSLNPFRSALAPRGDEKAQAETSTAIAPGVSIAASLLLMIRAFQIIVGQHMPMFPRRIAVRPLLRNIILLLTPVPLSNVVAARVIALSSLADLEEDGSYSRIALRASVIVLAVELPAVWEATLGVKWILASGGSLRRLVLRLVRPSL